MLGEPDWNSMNIPKILLIFTGVPGKPFKVLGSSGISQDFESAGFGILHILLVGNLEIFMYQFSVFHSRGGGVGYCLEQPIVVLSIAVRKCDLSVPYFCCRVYKLGGTEEIAKI